MASRSLVSLGLVAFCLTACGKGPDPVLSAAGAVPSAPQPEKPDPDPQPEPPQNQQPEPQPHPHPQPHPQPAPQPAPPPGAPDLGSLHRAALWSRVPGTVSWTRAVAGIVRARLRDFEQARDVEQFCPGYRGASLAQREVCWLRLVGGVVEFESSFRPDEPPFYEGHGVYSVGLLALSTGECPNAPTQKQLMNPVENLICGVNKMAALIGRDHAVDGPGDGGAAAYWSTLRPPHKVQLPSGRWAVIGKKPQIVARTRLYRQFH